MVKFDNFNLTLVKSKEEVDQINKKFYGRYNYPWPPTLFPAYPPGMAELFLNQDLGYWDHDRIPKRLKIWVPGCGTNQALFTALKFPEAEILGTDFSSESLAVCKRNAAQMGVKNLNLEERNLNESMPENEYDYIICTGVIHHNANPRETLSKIAGALKKNGVLELMVYNYYHKVQSTAFQKALRTFYDTSIGYNMEFELSLTRELMRDFPYQNIMGDFIRSHSSYHESEVADSLLQPVEYSYTIESLASMAEECNLECLIHCLNQYDISHGRMNWNTNFGNSSIQDAYDALPDLKRWQITNLLLLNESPRLWFYFQRKDSDYVRKTERQICDEFLERKFTKNSFLIKNYFLETNGDYKLSDRIINFPIDEPHEDAMANKILELANSDRKMKDILSRLNLSTKFQKVNDLRIKLTTTPFPYLR